MATPYTGTSIVDYIKSTGGDSSFGARTTLAKQYGITDYTGLGPQNDLLLSKLRSGAAPAIGSTTVTNPLSPDPYTGLNFTPGNYSPVQLPFSPNITPSPTANASYNPPVTPTPTPTTTPTVSPTPTPRFSPTPTPTPTTAPASGLSVGTFVAGKGTVDANGNFIGPKVPQAGDFVPGKGTLGADGKYTGPTVAEGTFVAGKGTMGPFGTFSGPTTYSPFYPTPTGALTPELKALQGDKVSPIIPGTIKTGTVVPEDHATAWEGALRAGRTVKEYVVPPGFAAIPGDEFVEYGGKTLLVPDGETRASYIDKLDNQARVLFNGIADGRTRDQVATIELQNENALRSIGTQLGMDAKTVRGLIDTDPGVRLLYDEAFKAAKAGKKYSMTPDNEGNIVPPPTGGADGAGGNDGGVVPVPDYVKTRADLLEAAGVNQLTDDISQFEQEQAAMNEWHEARKDEIRNNPEFPQWLKSRRDEWISDKQLRADKFYVAKLEALNKQRDRKEKLVVDTMNAMTDQYKLELDRERLIFDKSHTASSDDQNLLADLMKTFAEQGRNWADLTQAERNTILSKFNDKTMADIFGAFDFKDTRAKEYAYKYAAIANQRAAANKIKSSFREEANPDGTKTTYMYTFNSDGSAKDKIAVSLPAIESFGAWAIQNKDNFTKAQLEQVATSIGLVLTDKATKTIVSENKSTLEDTSKPKEGIGTLPLVGGFFGGGVYPTKPRTTEDATSSYNAYRQKMLTERFSPEDTGVGGGTTPVPPSTTVPMDQVLLDLKNNLDYWVPLHGTGNPPITRETIIETLTKEFPELSPQDIADTVYQAIPNK